MLINAEGLLSLHVVRSLLHENELRSSYGERFLNMTFLKKKLVSQKYYNFIGLVFKDICIFKIKHTKSKKI